MNKKYHYGLKDKILITINYKEDITQNYNVFMKMKERFLK